MNGVVFYYVVSLLIAYLFGWALSIIKRFVVRTIGSRLERRDQRLIEYPDKNASVAAGGRSANFIIKIKPSPSVAVRFLGVPGRMRAGRCVASEVGHGCASLDHDPA